MASGRPPAKIRQAVGTNTFSFQVIAKLGLIHSFIVLKLSYSWDCISLDMFSFWTLGVMSVWFSKIRMLFVAFMLIWSWRPENLSTIYLSVCHMHCDKKPAIFSGHRKDQCFYFHDTNSGWWRHPLQPEILPIVTYPLQKMLS